MNNKPLRTTTLGASALAGTPLETVLPFDTTGLPSHHQAILNQNKGLWAKLFPGAMVKLLQNERLRLAQSEFDFRSKAIELAFGARLEDLKGKLDSWLRMKASEDLAEQTLHLMGLFEQLRIDVEMRRQNFVAHLRERFNFAEKLDGMPVQVKARYLQSCDTELALMFDFFDEQNTRILSMIESKSQAFLSLGNR
jgi:hypothetical protein